MDVYENIINLGLELYPIQIPSGRYAFGVPFSGNMLYTSGANCNRNGIPIYQGKVGKDVTIEESQQCAEQCVMNILSNLHVVIGDLNRINRVVKVLGFVASSDDFYKQPLVLNAASDLLYHIFGDSGVGARSAIGVISLPNNIPVEIEILFELKDNNI